MTQIIMEDVALQNLSRHSPEVGSSYKSSHVDLEMKGGDDQYLLNEEVKSFAWKGITCTVKDRNTKQDRVLLDHVDGLVEAGELCAIMGPSGSGKTTLLNMLAQRHSTAKAIINVHTYLNGKHASDAEFRSVSRYVEQEDALVGSLTVAETLHFAARLAHKKSISSAERTRRINSLLSSFGLTGAADTIIGTPIRKGISGGQKRRVSVASQLITAPKILFLDEPTSGLDAAAAREVMGFVKDIATRYHLIIIASIHQPSTRVYELFDKIMLLSEGRTQFFGGIGEVASYFAGLGHPIPEHMNPAEHLLEITNTDFSLEATSTQSQADMLHESWLSSPNRRELLARIEVNSTTSRLTTTIQARRKNDWYLIATLVRRAFLKSRRDVIAYGVRVAMYIALALMMGTIWLRLGNHQSAIQAYQNAIFFGSAFMSFMAVAYVPSFLEDRATFIKERDSGLYGAGTFVFSNFLIGIPYLFLIATSFSLIAYFATGFQNTPSAFFTWVMWLFLDLLAAESLVVLISSLFPIFVVALALTAFANGLWMCTGGFLITQPLLNNFYRYVFHYIDYQSYVFEGMMINEFQNRVYDCDAGCHCLYQTELAEQCKVSGKGVLAAYGYASEKSAKGVGIMLCIIFVYRFLAWIVLSLKKR